MLWKNAHYGIIIKNFFKKLYNLYKQGDQNIVKKCPFFYKVAKTVAKQNNAKKYMSKLNLKFQNIYIKLCF